MSKPLIILLTTATTARLDSITARVSYALARSGAMCATVECDTIKKSREFIGRYKNNSFRGIDFIFVQNSVYVDMAVAKKANGSLWANNAILPDLSFLIEYSDWLHAKFMPANTYRLPCDYYADLPDRAFGANEHHNAYIETTTDEIFVSGKILGVIHRFQNGKFL